MALCRTDQIHLNSAAGHLPLSDALDNWHQLAMIEPKNRAQTEVPVVKLVVCRRLKDWELAARAVAWPNNSSTTTHGHDPK